MRGEDVYIGLGYSFKRFGVGVAKKGCDSSIELGNLKRYSHSGKQAVSLKNKLVITIQPSNCSPGLLTSDK